MTLDLVNASFILGTGGQIDGSLIARSGSTFTVNDGTVIVDVTGLTNFAYGSRRRR